MGSNPTRSARSQVDIGEYDTCPQGCRYCYADRDQATAVRNLLRHEPSGEALLPLADRARPDVLAQLRLFEPP
ncbi:MAG: hypothetical protein IH851_05860 [Armatimonadetes bacterium]|nr:hypothetical protein [Armatimonadota bacterium]